MHSHVKGLSNGFNYMDSGIRIRMEDFYYFRLESTTKREIHTGPLWLWPSAFFIIYPVPCYF